MKILIYVKSFSNILRRKFWKAMPMKNSRDSDGSLPDIDNDKPREWSQCLQRPRKRERRLQRPDRRLRHHHRWVLRCGPLGGDHLRLYICRPVRFGRRIWLRWIISSLIILCHLFIFIILYFSSGLKIDKY